MKNDKALVRRSLRLALALGVLAAAPLAIGAQGPGTQNGLWTNHGGAAWHTR
jgi:hypothetical protein